LVAGALLSLLLSFGKNLGFLTNFFIDFVPLYDKFRAVSSIQVILELCVPALGILGLHQFFKNTNKSQKVKALKNTFVITGGIALGFFLLKDVFLDFVGANDGFYRQNYGNEFVDAVIEDRKSLFSADALRSFILVALAATVLYGFAASKLNSFKTTLALGVLIAFDLVSINLNYVNNENFMPATRVDKPFLANAADLEILKDNSHYRVFDLSEEGRRSPARASYFHNSLGGYHAAKLGRYNDVYNFYVLNNNINVLNMLNTKYIIIENEQNQVFPYQNEEAAGNAWFIENLQTLPNENEVLLALDSLNFKQKAVSSNAFNYPLNYEVDSTATINLIEYQPNYLKYSSNNTNDGFAVFSEIYYSNGWKAFIDGEEHPIERVNYILRGLYVPKGNHTIEFKFEPEVVERGSKIMLAGAFVFVLVFAGGLYLKFRESQSH
jgi:hypothetical protein